MKPDFMAAAAEFKDDSRIVFAAVDCTTNNDLCQQHEVKGYPTFMYFHYLNKKSKKYTSGTTVRIFYFFPQNLKSLLDLIKHCPNCIIFPSHLELELRYKLFLTALRKVPSKKNRS